MITLPPKRGMALVVVLVLLAVMMLVTITLSGRMQQQLGRTRSQQEYQQALWYSASAESLALSALSLSLKNEKRVHLAQPWASGPRFFPLPQGQIAVTLRDAQACFNLNALAQPTTASRPLAVQQLIALISRLDVPAYRAELIAESLWEFIDEDRSVQTRLGREDSEYLARSVPFYAANQPLADISEMVHRYRSPQADVAQALDTLENKLVDFSALTAGLDMSRFHLMDFGTRRRFSREVQETIVKRLQQESWFVGTSNYDLARRLSLTPMGTQAHEWFQAHQQISPDLANSQRAALAAWLEEYPDQLGIALTDCITMDAFLRDFGVEFASRYQGLRHDSGDPLEWGEKAIAHYEKLGIDPQSKTLVFSDNLDLRKAVELYRHFSSRVQLSFGIGTRLTCDIPQVKPLNIVIKLVECNGKPVAKLSDSPGKTICHDKAFVRALRKAFDLPHIKKAS